MKKIINILFLSTLILSTNSCSDEDKTIDQILDIESGAVLRTININNTTLDANDPSIAFSVELEEQDREDGGLFKQVNLFVSLKDQTPDNGDTPPSKALIRTIPASAFMTGPVGLPRGTVTATLAEAVAAMGLSNTEFAPADVAVFDLELELTDGRKFDAGDMGGSVTGGFFNSPMTYSGLIIGCPPEPGDYVVKMKDSYGDGWQSDRGIVASIDGTETDILLANGTEGTFTLTVPPGTMELKWTYTGDSFPGEVSFDIVGPGGEELGNFSNPAVGILPVLLCL